MEEIEGGEEGGLQEGKGTGRPEGLPHLLGCQPLPPCTLKSARQPSQPLLPNLCCSSLSIFWLHLKTRTLSCTIQGRPWALRPPFSAAPPLGHRWFSHGGVHAPRAGVRMVSPATDALSDFRISRLPHRIFFGEN